MSVLSCYLKYVFKFKNNKNKKKTDTIIFISNELSRTGAPTVLLALLKWLKENTKLSFIVLASKGGEIESDFKAVAPTFVLEDRSIFPFLQELNTRNISLIYSNTFVNGLLQKIFGVLNVPQICHVHEMAYFINLLGSGNFKYIDKNTQQYIAVSNAVKNGLVEDFNVFEDRITMINAFIDIPKVSISEDEVRKLKSELNISPETFVLGSVGSTDWNKGVDIAITLAETLSKKLDNFKYIWLGASNNIINNQCMVDVKKAGLTEIFHFIPPSPDKYKYYELFDIFITPSREDSFPLVNLEAGFMKKPILCFEKSGGSQEFVSDDCGCASPYLDIEHMVGKIIELYNSPQERKKLGENAHKKIINELNTQIQAKKIYNIIKKYINHEDGRERLS